MASETAQLWASVRLRYAGATEVLDNLAQFRPGSAIKALFDWSKERIEYHKDEMDAHGREVAYFLAVERRFGQPV